MPERASPKEAASGSPIDAEASGRGAVRVNPQSAANAQPAAAGADAFSLLGDAHTGGAGPWQTPLATLPGLGATSTAFAGPQAAPASLESEAIAAALEEALPIRPADQAAEAAAAAAAAREQERGIFGLGRAFKSAVRAFKGDRPQAPVAPQPEHDESPEEPLPEQEHESAAAPPDDSYERPAGLSGHTSTVAMPEVLGFLAQLRKSGTLWIWNDREQFRVQLVDGNVTYARSESPRQGSLLGEILISQGAMEAESFQQFLNEARPAGPLGDALVRAGLVSPQALSGALQYQAQRVFNRAYGLEDAYFRFDAGEELTTLSGMRLSVTHMLFESARSRDESEQRLESVLGDPFESE